MQFNIAFIPPNNCCYKNNDNDINLTAIKALISEFITFVETDHHNLMDKICSIIKLTPNYVGDTDIVYETCDNLVQICYLSLENNNLQENEDDFNMLASIFAAKKIYGNAIILNARIDSTTYKCSDLTITLDELVDIFYKKYVHKGIYCAHNGEIKEFNYNFSPLEYLKLPEGNNEYSIVEFNSFNFYFSAYFKTKSSDPVNKVASRLLCKKVFGDVIFGMITTEHENLDFSRVLFMEFYAKSTGPISKRVVSKKEDEDRDIIPVNNGYCIIKGISDKHVCNACGKCDNLTICTGCYRVFYDTKECQASDWQAHKKECGETLN